MESRSRGPAVNRRIGLLHQLVHRNLAGVEEQQSPIPDGPVLPLCDARRDQSTTQMGKTAMGTKPGTTVRSPRHGTDRIAIPILWPGILRRRHHCRALLFCHPGKRLGRTAAPQHGLLAGHEQRRQSRDPFLRRPAPGPAHTLESLGCTRILVDDLCSCSGLRGPLPYGNTAKTVGGKRTPGIPAHGSGHAGRSGR